MGLEEHVDFLYKTAAYYMRSKLGLILPIDRIEINPIPKSAYSLWCKSRDKEGYAAEEAVEHLTRRNKEEADGFCEVGVCEIVDSGPVRYTITISCPDFYDDKLKDYWGSSVFGTIVHELAHVWDYENTERGQKDRDSRAAYAFERKQMRRALDDLIEIFPELRAVVPKNMYTFKAYTDFIASNAPVIHRYTAAWAEKAKRNPSYLGRITSTQEQLQTIGLYARSLEEKMGLIVPSQKELQEGWAQYIKMFAMQWWYQEKNIEDLDSVPKGAEVYLGGLRELEMWKHPAYKKLVDPAKHEKKDNGPYTAGLEKFNRFRKYENARKFFIKAQIDSEFPSE